MLKRFWNWYKRNYTLNVGIAAGLFVIQIIHLLWLTGEVAWLRAFGETLFEFEGVWKHIIVLVDYTEIPAIISTSLVYINDVREKSGVRPWLYLFLINSQWLHIFWITDEFVVTAFSALGATVLPLWLAWIAILIDYLELPVIYETIKKFVVSLRGHCVGDFLKEELPDM